MCKRRTLFDRSLALNKLGVALFCLLLPLLVSCGGIQQNAVSPGPDPGPPGGGSGGGNGSGGGSGGGGNEAADLDDSDLSKWKICVIGNCSGGGSPGGSHAPSSYSFTTGETEFSCDGHSALLTQTSANVAGNAYSNILATYRAGSQDDMNSFTSSYCIYPTGTIDEAEFDTYQFNRKNNTEFMFGTQCVTGKSWDIWNQATHKWVSMGSAAPCSLSLNSYHKLEEKLHWDPADTGNCGGQICMYFDSISVDGATVCAPCGSPQPSSALPQGWSSSSGVQFQIDINAPNKTGSMYIDLADFTTSQ